MTNFVLSLPLVVPICPILISCPGSALRGWIVITPSFAIDIFWNGGISIGSKSTDRIWAPVLSIKILFSSIFKSPLLDKAWLPFLGLTKKNPSPSIDKSKGLSVGFKVPWLLSNAPTSLKA